MESSFHLQIRHQFFHGAEKIEEFVIEKLASLGSDRTLLEKVVQKVEKQSKSQIRPMSHERRNMEERIKATNREIQNLLNLVKAGGESQQAVEEIKRLENSKREIEAKSIEIDAQIAQRKRAVYDVDAIQGALHRFARFIYKIPIQLQIYALRILIKRVTITREKIGVELHELPVRALQLALDERCWKEPKGLSLKMVEGLDSRRNLPAAADENDDLGEPLTPNESTSLNDDRPSIVDGRWIFCHWQNIRSRRDLNPRSLP